ncbi:MAG TPA: sugar phosphate isomerase/epimerase family protein [Planctomycetota bacterium]|nr:sugar phosphate isomerase/epimerase family protein [Planctomycetota bacterium]
MKRISIGSWAYTIGPYENEPVGFETVGSRLRELGYDGIELGGFPPHPNPTDLTDPAQREAVCAQMADWGLEFSGLAANLWGEHLINTGDTSRYIEEFTKNCGFCNDLGIAGIRVDTVQPPTIFTEVDHETALQRVTKTWNRCAEIAADHGLYVCWEFEPGFAFNKPSDILRVLDMVQRDNFGVLYDTSHGHMCAVVGARQPGEAETLAGGQIELIGKLSGRINHIHLIDSDNTCHKNAEGEDETSMHLPFGEGMVDFPPILTALAAEDIGHDWWTVDLCFWPDAWDATAHCKRTMDEFVATYT